MHWALAAVNLFPRFWKEALTLAKEGKTQELIKLMAISRPMLEICFMEPNPVLIKVGMKLLGMDCGEGRLPLEPARPTTVKAVEALVAEFNVKWGLLEDA